MNIENILNVDLHDLNMAMKTLRLLLRPVSKNIITLLENSGKAKVTVTDIYVTLRIYQPVASYYLNALEDAGILSVKKNGKFVYYTINKEGITKVTRAVKALK